MPSQRILTKTLIELADTLVDDFDVVDLLTMLADRCCEALDISDAGIMLAVPIGGSLQVMASSSLLMRKLEIYEIQSSEGPCLSCYQTGQPVLNELLQSATDKWPKFAPAALAAGFQIASAIPMRLRDVTIGALNLFRTEPTLIGDDEHAAARAFADIATIAILQNQAAIDAQTINTHLTHALSSRISVEQAKGMLAERATVDVDEAFRWLRRHARDHNLRLVTLAQGVIDGTVTIDMIEASRPTREA